MDSTINQINDLYSKADEDGRKQIRTSLRDLQNSFDTDWDVFARLGTGKPLEVVLVQIGCNLGIFRLLQASNTPITLEKLASESGASPALLARLLRGMSAFGLIKQTGPTDFSANRHSKLLTDPNLEGAIDHVFHIHFSCALALPAFLKERKYENITSTKDTVFQKAFNTDLSPFEWMMQHPEQMKALGHAMALQRSQHWTDSYPVEEEVGSFSAGAESALLVDVGGGFGQQAVGFKTKFPHLPGRIVVQDIPSTLDRAKSIEGVEFMVQDFFQPQKIEGGKFYYLRHVLHDWPQDDCVKILQNLIPAMGPDSRIVIDEVVLPDMDVSWQAAYMDLTMMASLGGVERTKAEWGTLLELAGLKVLDIHKYDSKMQSVILAVPK